MATLLLQGVPDELAECINVLASEAGVSTGSSSRGCTSSIPISV